MNAGRWQILWWPRWTLFFYRYRPFRVYSFVVYVWPIEVRRFAK